MFSKQQRITWTRTRSFWSLNQFMHTLFYTLLFMHNICQTPCHDLYLISLAPDFSNLYVHRQIFLSIRIKNQKWYLLCYEIVRRKRNVRNLFNFSGLNANDNAYVNSKKTMEKSFEKEQQAVCEIDHLTAIGQICVTYIAESVFLWSYLLPDIETDEWVSYSESWQQARHRSPHGTKLAAWPPAPKNSVFSCHVKNPTCNSDKNLQLSNKRKLWPMKNKTTVYMTSRKPIHTQAHCYDSQTYTSGREYVWSGISQRL